MNVTKKNSNYDVNPMTNLLAYLCLATERSFRISIVDSLIQRKSRESLSPLSRRSQNTEL